MDECSLYERILGLTSPWFVEEIGFDESEDSVEVYVALDDDAQLYCPRCGRPVPRYDKRQRRWRHLDTCQFQTFVTAQVPRIQCPDDGCLTISVPWADDRSRFTLLFEALVINWLKEASIASVSRRLSISWSAVDGIMQRAVKRGLSRRKRLAVKRIGVDETSFQKRHEYVTVVSTEEGRVLYVADGKGKESLRGFYQQLSKSQLASIESVSMDLSSAYIAVTREELPQANECIAFDKFHVAQYLTRAVDQVRQSERRELVELGRTRYLWLYNSASLNRTQKRTINALKRIATRTGRAWLIKEMAMSLWNYSSRTWAEKAWKRWYAWAIRSRLRPIKTMARMIKDNLEGIINAIVLNANNGQAESINSKIQMLKIKARGFRNRERFKTAILFHCGGLDLYPDPP